MNFIRLNCWKPNLLSICATLEPGTRVFVKGTLAQYKDNFDKMRDTINIDDISKLAEKSQLRDTNETNRWVASLVR